jgi:hypothetical protein
MLSEFERVTHPTAHIFPHGPKHSMHKECVGIYKQTLPGLHVPGVLLPDTDVRYKLFSSQKNK